MPWRDELKQLGLIFVGKTLIISNIIFSDGNITY